MKEAAERNKKVNKKVPSLYNCVYFPLLCLYPCFVVVVVVVISESKRKGAFSKSSKSSSKSIHHGIAHQKQPTLNRNAVEALQTAFSVFIICQFY